MVTIILILQSIVCIGLIIAILLKTTKSEGLSGTIGGKSETIFRGRKTKEEVIDRITSVLAVAFLILCLLLAILK